MFPFWWFNLIKLIVYYLKSILNQDHTKLLVFNLASTIQQILDRDYLFLNLYYVYNEKIYRMTIDDKMKRTLDIS